MINLNILWIIGGVVWAYKTSFYTNRKKLVVLVLPLIIGIVNYIGIRMLICNPNNYMSLTCIPGPVKFSLGLVAFFAYTFFLNIILTAIRSLRH